MGHNDFSGMDLTAFVSKKADYRGANFEGTNLEGAHFKGSSFENANFKSAVIKLLRGYGPSIVSLKKLGFVL